MIQLSRSLVSHFLFFSFQRSCGRRAAHGIDSKIRKYKAQIRSHVIAVATVSKKGSIRKLLEGFRTGKVGGMGRMVRYDAYYFRKLT